MNEEEREAYEGRQLASDFILFLYHNKDAILSIFKDITVVNEFTPVSKEAVELAESFVNHSKLLRQYHRTELETSLELIIEKLKQIK